MAHRRREREVREMKVIVKSLIVMALIVAIEAGTKADGFAWTSRY